MYALFQINAAFLLGMFGADISGINEITGLFWLIGGAFIGVAFALFVLSKVADMVPGLRRFLPFI